MPPDLAAIDRGGRSDEAPAAWPLALAAAALFAVDPAGTGGVVVRAPAGEVRDAWQSALRALLPEGAPWRRIPVHVNDSRLLGGLDLAATLQSGRPVAERGLLAEADGGVVVLAMAERVSASTAARLTAALDAGEVLLQRDGLQLRSPARFGVVAYDEGTADDEAPSAGLLDRLAFHLDLGVVGWRETSMPDRPAQDIASARALLPRVSASAEVVQALTATAATLGIVSLRAPLLALRAACAACALDGRTRMNDDDAALAARLVLAPRATRWPAEEDDDAEATPEVEDESRPSPDGDPSRAQTESIDRPLEDVVLEAARASIPPGLLAQLTAAGAAGLRSPAGGRAGQIQRARLRGRPAGTRRGQLRDGQRLNVLETLRAAAPWQPLRRAARTDARLRGRIDVRPDDFRVTQFKQRSQTTTIFVVDASGSAALHRLAEAKGAVELLLADCYVRRDRVALIAFRGRGAEIVLPPTRSLVRAKRGLAGLPGGGGTPLAAAIDAATELAQALAQRGDAPSLLFLTDGRANVARDGSGGRVQAERDALAAARRARARGFACVLVDTSARPEAMAERLAAEMGARYLPLPHADARAVSRAVQGLARA